MKFTLPHLVAFFAIVNFQSLLQGDAIAVDPVRILPSVKEQAQSLGHRLHLERFQELLEQDCQNELKRSGRFKVVARRDLDVIIRDLKQGASGLYKKNPDDSKQEIGGFTRNTILLVVTIKNFSFAKSTEKFTEIGRKASRIEIPYDVSANIYKNGSAEFKHSFSKGGTHTKSITSPLNFPAQDQQLDAEVVALSRLIAKAVAQDVADNEFPPKVMTVRGEFVTINRGSIHGIKKGDNFRVFGIGEELIDPDTNEKLGSEQIPVGLIEIIGVNQKFSNAKAIENFGIEKLSICKKTDAPAKPAPVSPGPNGDIGNPGPVGVEGVAAGGDATSVLLVVQNQNNDLKDIDVKLLAGFATNELNNNGLKVKFSEDIFFKGDADPSVPQPKFTAKQMAAFSDCSFALVIGELSLNTVKQTISRPDLNLNQEINTTSINLPYRLITNSGESVYSGVEREIYKDFGNDPIVFNQGSVYHDKVSAIFSSVGKKVGEHLKSKGAIGAPKAAAVSKFTISLVPFSLPFPELTPDPNGQPTIKSADTTFSPKAINVEIDGVLSGATFDNIRNLFTIEGSPGFGVMKVTSPGYVAFARSVKIKDGATFSIPMQPTEEFKKEILAYSETLEKMRLRAKITQAQIDAFLAQSEFLKNSKIVIEGPPPEKIQGPTLVLPR